MSEHEKRNEIMHECYEACKDMNFNDTFDLFENTDNEEEKDFFRMVTDFFLQQKQKKVVAEKRF